MSTTLSRALITIEICCKTVIHSRRKETWPELLTLTRIF